MEYNAFLNFSIYIKGDTEKGWILLNYNIIIIIFCVKGMGYRINLIKWSL